MLTRCGPIDHVSRLTLLACHYSFGEPGLGLFKCDVFMMKTGEFNSLSAYLINANPRLVYTQQKVAYSTIMMLSMPSQKC